MSLPAALGTSQRVTLPVISELYNPDFLDILVPARDASEPMVEVKDEHQNPMMEALKTSANYTYTANGAQAYSSTLSDTLDAFNMLRPYATGDEIFSSLDKAWKEDPAMSLRIIWNSRSIHDGKGDKEVFYQAWGWLYKNHPRTALQNLPQLVTPVSSIGKGNKAQLAPHGYWKDLLNILCLAALNQLGPLNTPAEFLHTPRQPYTKRRRYGRSHKEKKRPVLSVDEQKAETKKRRTEVAQRLHANLIEKLADPTFRALYIMVARLFAHRLAEDIKLLDRINELPDGEERVSLIHQITLASKWAPTPSCTHDRHSNIATAISLLLHHSYRDVLGAVPNIQASPVAELPELETHVIRSYFQRWFLAPLRKINSLPEPLMSANLWKQIRYTRVSSKCMSNNMELFYKHDPEGFQAYLEKVESGKKTISGATLMPHEILREIMACNDDMDYQIDPKKPSVRDARRKIAEMKVRAVEAQWKTMVQRLRETGTLGNALAICDVSMSMGLITDAKKSKHVQPILPSVALSLLLAQLAQPPFSNGFISFSESPQFIQLDMSKPFHQVVNDMVSSDWGMNTNLNAVFLKLLLPLAISHNVKQEDMIKRLFIFSDMQFDESQHGCPDPSDAAEKWETNHDVIEKAYKAAGYEMPEIVYWNLAQGGSTLPVLHDRKGVAIMSGFSGSLMKVFLGEQDEEDLEMEWEEVKKDGETVAVKKDEFNPVNVMKKALLKKSFDGLVVVD